MADEKKPFPVRQALEDGHTPESIQEYLRKSGRKADTTGVSAFMAKKVTAPLPHVPASRMPKGPFGTAQPPIAPETGVARPSYQATVPVPAVGRETAPADVVASMEPAAEQLPTRRDPFGWIPPAGMVGGAILAAPFGAPGGPVGEGLAATSGAGIGGATGKAVSQGLNRAFRTGYEPQNAPEAIRGVSAAGLEGMATEALGRPVGGLLSKGTGWLGNRIVRGGTGVGDEGASAMRLLNAPATRAGEKKLSTQIERMNDAVLSLARQADARAGAPQVNALEVMAPVRDLWMKELENNVITTKPRSAFANIWLDTMGRLNHNKMFTYEQLLEVKRAADRMVDYNKIARTARGGMQQQFTNEEEQAAKAVADRVREILNGLDGRTKVPGVPTQPMTIGEIHALEKGAIEARQGILATFEPRAHAGVKAFPFLAAGGTYAATHANLPAALTAYGASQAMSDPAVNSTIGLMLQNPAFLGLLRGTPQNLGRTGIGLSGGTGTK